MKETELGPLPEEWEVVRLGDSATVIMGQSPPGSTYNDKGQGMPFLQGKAEFGSTSPKHAKYTTKPLKVAPRGSVLVSVRAPVGDVNFSDIEYCIGRGLASLSLNHGDNGYLFYQLMYSKRRIAKEGTGSTFKAINKGKLQELRIPLPQLHEQKRIVAILSAVQEAKAKTEEVTRATNEIKESLMKHLFTYGPVPVDEAENVQLKETEIGTVPEDWELVKIEDVACINKENMDPTREMPDSLFTYIDIAGVEGDTGRIVEAKNMLGRNAPSRARRVIHSNDIILSTVRPYLKAFAVVSEEYDNQICSTGFAVLTPKGRIISEYLLYASYSEPVGKQFESQMRGANYPAINTGHVRQTKIPLPPLSEQKKIVAMLTAVHSKIEAEENRKKALEDLFKTLLHSLMTAKIRVNNLEIEI